jgi:hypothetical protein
VWYKNLHNKKLIYLEITLQRIQMMLQQIILAKVFCHILSCLVGSLNISRSRQPDIQTISKSATKIKFSPIDLNNHSSRKNNNIYIIFHLDYLLNLDRKNIKEKTVVKEMKISNFVDELFDKNE